VRSCERASRSERSLPPLQTQASKEVTLKFEDSVRMFFLEQTRNISGVEEFILPACSCLSRGCLQVLGCKNLCFHH